MSTPVQHLGCSDEEFSNSPETNESEGDVLSESSSTPSSSLPSTQETSFEVPLDNPKPFTSKARIDPADETQ